MRSQWYGALCWATLCCLCIHLWTACSWPIELDADTAAARTVTLKKSKSDMRAEWCSGCTGPATDTVHSDPCTHSCPHVRFLICDCLQLLRLHPLIIHTSHESRFCVIRYFFLFFFSWHELKKKCKPKSLSCYNRLGGDHVVSCNQGHYWCCKSLEFSVN